LLELAEDPEITSPEVRAIPDQTPSEGVGIVEAPRGTLMHHYWTDKNGIVEKVNIIVATAHNYAGMCMDVKRSAQALIKGGKVNDGLLNMVEMAFRAYDPCMACATHCLPGEMPMTVDIYNGDRELIEKITR